MDIYAWSFRETEDGRPFISMEYIEGDTLDQRLRRGALPIRDVVGIGMQVSGALDCAHGRGVIHRDIKPSNIVLHDDSPRQASPALQVDVDRIRRELIARGHDVLPDRPLPLIGPELEAAIRGYLGRCHVSLHPIGSFYGVIPEGADCSLIELQNRLAGEHAALSDLHRLIWMPRSLQPPARSALCVN